MALSDYVLALQHIGVPTSDLKKSTAFFVSLGFYVIERETIPNSENQVAFLQCRNVVLEIYEEPGMGSPRTVGAIDHIALDVSDIQATYAEALAMDLPFVEEGIQFLPFGIAGVRYFSVKGPDNVIVEYNQKLSAENR
jgi:catechol 2,3-dioxygenase-like lactoylglutathione lyase family enzyme